MDKLYDKLISYQKYDDYPFHMPGHKRNTEVCQMINPYSIDITEIEGFDNLHQAEGILLDLSKRISLLYGSGKSYPLVNGSTVGILSAISAAADKHSKVLVARNCHKAVYHALILRELKPVYLYPKHYEGEVILGGISAEEIKEALIKEPDIATVIITSPTYDGIVSDIKAIADVVHSFGALLIVDEAHGAHMGFHKGFPESAVTQGADIIVQSLHKTLPALTQTAVLHSNRADLNDRIEYYLSVYESSSPSYLLLSSIDQCISILEEQGKELFDSYVTKLNEFYNKSKQLKHIKLINQAALEHKSFIKDPSKIVISVRGTELSGHHLHTLLREKYHLIMEMEAPEYVLGITSICDTSEGFERLLQALLKIDATLTDKAVDKSTGEALTLKQEQVMLPAAAAELPSELIPLEQSAGRIAAALVSMYPPGSPLLVPGERIDYPMIDYISRLKKEGYTITGLSKDAKDKIYIISNAV